MAKFKVGQRILLKTKDSFNGILAKIATIEDERTVTLTSRAHPGRFAASFDELVPIPEKATRNQIKALKDLFK